MNDEELICPLTNSCFRYGAIGCDCDHRRPHRRWDGCSRVHGCAGFSFEKRAQGCIPVGTVAVVDEYLVEDGLLWRMSPEPYRGTVTVS